MWFKSLFGFYEVSPKIVQKKIIINDTKLTSLVNDKSFTMGSLDIVSLKELRERSNLSNHLTGKLIISEVVADAASLHTLNVNNGATFQVASQFNLLEMKSPFITPEEGVDIYGEDFTQGPACAIACGAATVYRNYFVKLDNQLGQTEDKQIDCLDLIGRHLGNKAGSLWEMKNGYVISSLEKLEDINTILQGYDDLQKEELKSLLRIGVHSGCQVTIEDSNNKVTQVFSSALPVSYNDIAPELWEPFARLILEATYEATLYAALENFLNTGNNRVYLTLVGGGAFGNKPEWIIDSINKALHSFINVPLDVRIVSFVAPNAKLKEVIGQRKKKWYKRLFN